MSIALARRARILRHWAAGALVLFGPGLAAAQQADGPEFAVNTYTTGSQTNPQLARGAAGEFIIVWNGAGADDTAGVFAQLYDAGGAAMGGQFRVNTFTTGSQFTPAAAAIGAGDFIVVWASTGQDGSSSGVFGRRVSAAGALLGAEFRVNTYTSGFQDSPRVAGSPGGFVVSWDSGGQDGDSYGIFGQCYTAGGAQVGLEFQVNTVTTLYQFRSDVAMNASGSFAVVWTDFPRAHSYAQLYAPDCTRQGGEFQAHGGVLGTVGMDAAGNFVVAAMNADGDSYGVWAQRFSAGAAQGAEFQVSTYTTESQEVPDVAVSPGGDFVVTWHTYEYATQLFVDASARAFRADGMPATPEFTVNSYTTGEQAFTSVGIGADGRFVVAWINMFDGDGFGIAARRFLSADVIFADGFE
jgi:hypothetical protein